MEEAKRAISAPTIYVKSTPGIGDIDVIKRTRVTTVDNNRSRKLGKKLFEVFWFTSLNDLEGVRWLVKREYLRI